MSRYQIYTGKLARVRWIWRILLFTPNIQHLSIPAAMPRLTTSACCFQFILSAYFNYLYQINFINRLARRRFSFKSNSKHGVLTRIPAHF